jgi:tetratricopeptide (TPR) repeat protein
VQRKRYRSLICSLFCLWAAAATAQENLEVQNARGLAAALEARGEREAAASIAESLLKLDPTDASAWVVIARIRRAEGDTEGALEAARRANAYADSDDERYAAAVELAAGNFTQDRGLVAQFWLRRAAQVAPTDKLRDAAVRNFQIVRARTPWSWSLGFNLVPSSNVNNGSRADTIEIAGLPFVLSGDSQRLSGIEATLTGSFVYRFVGYDGQPAQIFGGIAIQRVALSDEAKERAPDADAGDYAFDALELGYTQVVSSWSDNVALRAEALVGRNWYGGEPLSNYARGGLTTQWAVGNRSLATLTASLERQVRLDESDRSAWLTRLDARRIWQVNDRGDVFGLDAGVRRVKSDSVEIDHEAVLFSVDYTFSEPVIGPASLGLGLNLEYRDYAGSPFSSVGRQDQRGSLRATFGAPGWNYYGFGPTLTFEASQTESNVDLYDVEDFGVRLGITSVF